MNDSKCLFLSFIISIDSKRHCNIFLTKFKVQCNGKEQIRTYVCISMYKIHISFLYISTIWTRHFTVSRELLLLQSTMSRGCFCWCCCEKNVERALAMDRCNYIYRESKQTTNGMCENKKKKQKKNLTRDAQNKSRWVCFSIKLFASTMWDVETCTYERKKNTKIITCIVVWSVRWTQNHHVLDRSIR